MVVEVKNGYVKNGYVDFYEYDVCIPDEYEQELGDMIIRYANTSVSYKEVLEKVADEFLATDEWCSVVWDFCRETDCLDEYEFCGVKTVVDLNDAFLDATGYYLSNMPLRRWFIEYWTEKVIFTNDYEVFDEIVEYIDGLLDEDFTYEKVRKGVMKAKLRLRSKLV